MPLSASQRSEIQETFNRFDLDRNGSIDANELRTVLAEIGEKDVPGYRIRELIAEVDTDKSGTIEFNEFIAIIEKIRSGKSDSDGSGFAQVVKKAGNLNIISGTSSLSTDGTTHSYSDDEKLAFVDWVNYVLASDADLKPILPIAEEGDALFKSLRTGVLLCKLINDAVPETIDERAINKKGTHPLQLAENQTLMLNSARAIGCNVVNIGPDDIMAGTQHLCLGLIWQIVKIGLFARINLQNCPGLARLLEGDETIEQLMALPVETILLRWFNYHLREAGHPRRVNNFSGDIKDSECYTILIKQIAPPGAGVDTRALQEHDTTKRAEIVLKNAEKIDCRKFVRARDIVRGNAKLNLAFVANMFNHHPALEPIEVVIIEETREEKAYRNWMNSLGVNPFVNNLYADLRDGLVLLQLFDKIQPGIVDWKRANQPPFKAMGGNMKKLENCNYALELGKQMKFSLVGIQGKDVFDGTNKTLCLALIWQMFRAYILAILTKLSGGNGRIQDAEIIEWVNDTLGKNGKPADSQIRSFKDSQIATAEPIIDLIDCIKPGCIDYSLVIKRAGSEGDRLKNAKYAISMARKAGAGVFALPEDVVEVKPKAMMALYACIMAASYN